MIHFDGSQVDLKDSSGKCSTKAHLGSFGKSQTVVLRTEERTKWMTAKAQPRKIYQLLIKRWTFTKNKMGRQSSLKKNLKRSRDWKFTCFGGSPNNIPLCLKVCKVSFWDFFPGKTWKPFACKRNYFVLQSETATFAYWRKRNVECINVIKWAMLKRSYFVFSCVSLTMRAF